jgi:hypothetical protein
MNNSIKASKDAPYGNIFNNTSKIILEIFFFCANGRNFPVSGITDSRKPEEYGRAIAEAGSILGQSM